MKRDNNRTAGHEDREEGGVDEVIEESDTMDTYDDDDDMRHNDNDANANDDEDDDDDQDEDDDKGLVSELKEMWQQHLVAILVAVVATVFAHRHLNDRLSPPPTHHNMTLVEKHEFLLDYQRTANLSFCGRVPRPSKELQVLEFSITKNQMPSVARHLAADVLQDDKYEHVFGDDETYFPSILAGHDEYACLDRQHKEQHGMIKGHAYFYPSPSVQSMYPQQKAKSSSPNSKKKSELQAVYLTFTGFAIKFVNLSPQPVLLYWEGHTRRLVGEIGPFESLGTASQSSGQTFAVTPLDDPDNQLDRWIVTVDNPILYYDPRGVERTPEQEQKYRMHQLNKQYEMEYSLAGKRPWLAHFPRPLPVHPFWSAEQFGQTHRVPIDSGDGRERSLELTVASVTPRVFTIPNFLSKRECQELIQLAQKEGLQPSTLTSGMTRARQQRDQSTRSSSNTWVPRSSTPLADQIYRRAAKVLQMDEALLQPTDGAWHAHEHSLAESLQVVRYKQTEEYTAHHDFVYPPTFHRHQPTRFATLLLYLNDDFEGGETVFPRAVNAQYHDGITITPQQGTAVLFYNLLPDGNMDDLSQHASKPVEKGEKWLANLWVWEPHIY